MKIFLRINVQSEYVCQNCGMLDFRKLKVLIYARFATTAKKPSSIDK